MSSDFSLNTLLARNAPANEDDVLNVKGLLNRVGYYDEPSYGITPYPDGRLFQSIARFQKDHDLTPDGWMRPGGETETAMRLVAGRGKPGLVDEDFGFPAAGDFRLQGEVGKGHTSREHDVLAAKRAMGALGYYPKRLLLDPIAIVDRELHNGITQFQSDNKLYTDGWMAPNGETASAVREALAAREAESTTQPEPELNQPEPKPEPGPEPEEESALPPETSPKEPDREKQPNKPDPVKIKERCRGLRLGIIALRKRLPKIEKELNDLDAAQRNEAEELEKRRREEALQHGVESGIHTLEKVARKIGRSPVNAPSPFPVFPPAVKTKASPSLDDDDGRRQWLKEPGARRKFLEEERTTVETLIEKHQRDMEQLGCPPIDDQGGP